MVAIFDFQMEFEDVLKKLIIERKHHDELSSSPPSPSPVVQQSSTQSLLDCSMFDEGNSSSSNLQKESKIIQLTPEDLMKPLDVVAKEHSMDKVRFCRLFRTSANNSNTPLTSKQAWPSRMLHSNLHRQHLLRQKRDSITCDSEFKRQRVQELNKKIETLQMEFQAIVESNCKTLHLPLKYYQRRTKRLEQQHQFNQFLYQYKAPSTPPIIAISTTSKSTAAPTSPMTDTFHGNQNVVFS